MLGGSNGLIQRVGYLGHGVFSFAFFVLFCHVERIERKPGAQIIKDTFNFIYLLIYVNNFY